MDRERAPLRVAGPALAPRIARGLQADLEFEIFRGSLQVPPSIRQDAHGLGMPVVGGFHKTGLSFSHQISHTHTRFFHPESSNNDINSSSSSNSQSLNMSAALFTATAPQILIHSLPLPQVKRAGEGSCPGHGAQVRVDYSAWVEGLPGGPVDSSTDRGEALLFPFPTLTLTLTLIRKAVVFCLGKGEVLKGVDQVVSTMQVRRNLPSNPNPTPDPNPD